MREWLFDVFRERPWWMSAVMVFCAYMAFVYMPWDILVKPVAEDEADVGDPEVFLAPGVVAPTPAPRAAYCIVSWKNQPEMSTNLKLGNNLIQKVTIVYEVVFMIHLPIGIKN